MDHPHPLNNNSIKLGEINKLLILAFNRKNSSAIHNQSVNCQPHHSSASCIIIIAIIMDAQAKKKLFRAKLNAQKQQEKKQRIDSPFLRYTEEGQLVCKVCEMVIKSEALWPAHQVSRKHHEAIDKLKAKAAEQNKSTNSKTTAPTKQVSRPTPESPEKSVPSTVTHKRQQSNLPANFFDNQDTKMQKKDSGKLKDSDLHSGGSVSATVHVLEPLVPESGTKINADLEVKQVKGALPKGFFDDNDADLRARGIKIVKPDVKDEYKEFEKLIQEDLQEVDDRLEEEEIDTAEMIQEEESVEQMTYRERVELLRRKKLELRASRSTVPSKNVEIKDKDSSSDDSSSEDENFVVDWRAKHL